MLLSPLPRQTGLVLTDHHPRVRIHLYNHASCTSLVTLAVVSAVARGTAASLSPTPIARLTSVTEVSAEHVLPRRNSSPAEKRDLTKDGIGKFLAPNTSSLTAACYPMYIELYTPGPPRNVTAWFSKNGRDYSQLAYEWPRVDNPWVNENISVSATWERLSIGPGTTAFVTVYGYLNDYVRSIPFTVQPSNDRSCYNDYYTGDGVYGNFTGGGITTTYAPSGSKTRSSSDLPTLISGASGSSLPTAISVDSSPAKKASIVGPVVGAVVGTLAVVGVALGIWFCLRRKKRAEKKRIVGLGKGGATAAGDEAPYVVDLVGDEDHGGHRMGGIGMREREGSIRPQSVQAYTYGSSGQSAVHDPSTPFMARGATSDEHIRPTTAVFQERDLGMNFPVDSVPPDYADATATSSQDAGSILPRSPSSHVGPNFMSSASATTPSEVTDERRSGVKTMRG